MISVYLKDNSLYIIVPENVSVEDFLERLRRLGVDVKVLSTLRCG